MSALGDRFVGCVLQRRRLAAPELPVGGDQQLGLGVVDPGAQRVGGEAGEHHAVHQPSRAQASIATMASGIIGR